MKVRLVAIAAIAAISWCSVAGATEHYQKGVQVIQTGISDCYFFQLTGVTESDPVTPNSPWFAILRTQANGKEMYATLMTAKTTGTNLARVITNGATVCGHAQVSQIDF